jgi:gamma-glutamyltranspeptidase / glutathione hydrolase
LRNRVCAALCLAFLLACTHSSAQTPATATTAPSASTAGISPDWPLTGKARVTEAPKAMVVSGNPIASEVGRDILRQGGNAVDAAVAVGMALAVVHPEAGNLGGGGFMIIRIRDTTYALDYREMAPGKASRDMYLALSGDPSDLSLDGALAAGVPGAVAGMIEAHRRFGKLPLATVMAPAIRLADQGFVIDDYRSASLDDAWHQMYNFASSRQVYFPTGRAPLPGTTLVQHDLARTLTAVRDSGWAGFYRGPVSDLIVAEMERSGGIITHQDLEAYKAIWREPIKLSYRDYTIYSMPPASSGGVTLGMILNIMEGYGKLPAFGSPELLHREAEAMRRAFVDRNTYLGDPGFVRMPLEHLLSKAYADSLRRTTDLEHANPTPHFDPSLRGGSSTTHYSVVDADGNAVSCTTTLNDSYGDAVTVTGAGFLLNDEMDDFATAPGKPNMYGLVQGEANAIAPGKRMLSAMTPTIVLDPQQHLYLVLGTPGGPRIFTMVYHVLSNVIDHRMALPDAIAAPRMHHQGLPDSIQIETGGFPEATLDSLRARGHAIEASGYWGDIEAIIRTPAGWQGVSDPRRGGGGAGD